MNNKSTSTLKKLEAELRFERYSPNTYMGDIVDSGADDTEYFKKGVL